MDRPNAPARAGMAMRVSVVLAALSLFAVTARAQEAVAQDPDGRTAVAGRLRAVRVDGGDVFDPDEANWLEQLVDALHWQTRESVVRREMWFGPGDAIDSRTAAEFERNLRALGLFAEAHVRLVPTGAPGEYDLEVTTRDRLTLNFGAGASYVGGVGGVRGSIGEGNFLGLGDRIALAFAGNSEDEYRGSFSYTDLHVLDSWHTGSVQLSRTEEGDSFALGVRRPFKHLLAPRADGARFAHTETEVDYYRLGDSIAEVPTTSNAFAADIAWATGPRERRNRLGLVLELEQRDYLPARGPAAATIRVPGDTTTAFAGPTVRWEHISAFRKVEGLDTLQFVQDLRLGVDLAFTAGARWRDEVGADAEVQPEVRTAARWAAEPVESVFTNLRASGAVRFHGSDAVGWRTTLAARVFALATEDHTLGLGCTFDAVEETQGLPPELTLGEDDGLRGYRSRLFAGTRRLVVNAEHRFDTGIELLTLRLGTIAFFDVGQVGRGSDLGRTWASAGIGLRIGSDRLLGRNVLRIDLARPLDRVTGESGGWLASVTIGHVFTFDGDR